MRELREGFARRTGERIQLIRRPGLRVDHVVEEGAELGAGGDGCRVRDQLHDVVALQRRGNHAADIVQRLRDA